MDFLFWPRALVCLGLATAVGSTLAAFTSLIISMATGSVLFVTGGLSSKGFTVFGTSGYAATLSLRLLLRRSITDGNDLLLDDSTESFDLDLLGFGLSCEEKRFRGGSGSVKVNVTSVAGFRGGLGAMTGLNLAGAISGLGSPGSVSIEETASSAADSDMAPLLRVFSRGPFEGVTGLKPTLLLSGLTSGPLANGLLLVAFPPAALLLAAFCLFLPVPPAACFSRLTRLAGGALRVTRSGDASGIARVLAMMTDLW